MAVVIPSLWKGFGADYLAYSIDKFGIQGAFGKVPKIGHAAVFFTSIDLVDRFIEWRVVKDYENEAISKEKSIILTTELIAFKILLPYLVYSALSLEDTIPLSFIHLQSSLYGAALIDGEFENQAAKCFPRQWKNHEDTRWFPKFAESFKRSFLSLFNQ
jgi:hypothetical protein